MSQVTKISPLPLQTTSQSIDFTAGSYCWYLACFFSLKLSFLFILLLLSGVLFQNKLNVGGQTSRLYGQNTKECLNQQEWIFNIDSYSTSKIMLRAVTTSAVFTKFSTWLNQEREFFISKPAWKMQEEPLVFAPFWEMKTMVSFGQFLLHLLGMKNCLPLLKCSLFHLIPP